MLALALMTRGSLETLLLLNRVSFKFLRKITDLLHAQEYLLDFGEYAQLEGGNSVTTPTLSTASIIATPSTASTLSAATAATAATGGETLASCGARLIRNLEVIVTVSGVVVRSDSY